MSVSREAVKTGSRRRALRPAAASARSRPLRDPGPSDPVLSVENLHKRFGSFVALDSACLEVRRGEFFAVLGPSGCGKTTLLRLVAGFEEPTSGTVRLGGVDVTRVPPWKRDVNTVFQQYALFPHLDVFDNAAFGPRTRGVPEAEVARRVREALDVVRVGHLAKRRPDRLSGGEKQRVALARALVNSPAVLLLDEPLSALDPGLRRAMQDELRRIQRESGVAFVMVTHDQGEALGLADRLAVLRAGRIRQAGTPEDLWREPDDAFVASFLGAANLVPVRVLDVAADGADVEFANGRRARVQRAAGAGSRGNGVVMVRPERVALDESEPGADGARCAFAVIVRDVAFQGAALRCTLVDADGREFVAAVDESRRPPGLAPGARFWATWASADARLLDPEEEETT